MTPITISVVGSPQGKGRARSFVRGGRVGHYTPTKTRSYESLIYGTAVDAMGEQPAFDQPVEFVLRAVFPVPASWSKRKQQRAIIGEIKPGKKPDLDNIAKVWNDALNGVVYRDDSLICRMTLDKRYGPQALVVCMVRPMTSLLDHSHEADRAQADALEIDASAKRRLADEYDAAQERGEITGPADRHSSSRAELNKPTAADIGLTRKEIHEARIIRDAEASGLSHE